MKVSDTQTRFPSEPVDLPAKRRRRLNRCLSLLNEKPDLGDGAWLIFREEAGALRTVRVEERVDAGRDPDSTIVLPNEQASRRHFCVDRRGDDLFFLEDLNSKNRTLLNGKPCTCSLLRNGDLIEAAGIELMFLDDLDES